jgi:hypothetical protein
MKIDNTMNLNRMAPALTGARQTESFSNKLQTGIGNVAGAVAGGVGVAANMLPGGAMISSALSSLTQFAGGQGGGSSQPYMAGAASASGSVPVNTGGGVPGAPGMSNGNVPLPGGGGVSGGEFNNEMSSMFTEQKKLLGVQITMQRENQVFSTISNVLKTRHDTAKNAIGNIR